MLPDAFFAIDGMFETFLTILDQMDAYPAVIADETAHYLPFLMTTTIMMEAVKAGVGRETAHKAIKEHALATVAELRSGAIDRNNLIERLAADSRIGLQRATLRRRQIPSHRLRCSRGKNHQSPPQSRRLQTGIDPLMELGKSYWLFVMSYWGKEKDIAATHLFPLLLKFPADLNERQRAGTPAPRGPGVPARSLQ
jgi:hypothetical protein